MKIFKLKYSQKLPISLNEAWDFLSSPSNLELITPKSMDFNITDYDKKKAYPGQIIQYTVKPLLGIRLIGLLRLLKFKTKSSSLMNKDLVLTVSGITNISLKKSKMVF